VCRHAMTCHRWLADNGLSWGRSGHTCHPFAERWTVV
jgi:hypothetical protein